MRTPRTVPRVIYFARLNGIVVCGHCQRAAYVDRAGRAHCGHCLIVGVSATMPKFLIYWQEYGGATREIVIKASNSSAAKRIAKRDHLSLSDASGIYRVERVADDSTAINE